MKRVGVIFLVFLVFYNISFSLYYSTFEELRDCKGVQSAFENNKDVLAFDVSNDSPFQPFLMDSEFSNINANISCFTSELNLNPGLKAINLLNLSANFFIDSREVIITSILISHKFFISTNRLTNLLGNLFSFRI